MKIRIHHSLGVIFFIIVFICTCSVISAQTWTPLYGPSYNTDCYVNAIAANNNKIYVATYLGLLSSTNNGATWNITALWGTSVTSLTIDSLGNIYCGEGDIYGYGSVGGVYRSSDEGEHWQKIYDNQDTTIRYYNVTSIVVNVPREITISTMYPSGGSILRSTDNGETWHIIRSQSPDGILSLYVAPTGAILTGTSESGLYESTDNGNTWVHSTLNYIVHCFANEGTRIYIGHSGGISFSDDNGATWRPTSCTLSILSLAIDTDGTLYAGADGGGFWRSTDHGAHWIELIQGIPFDIGYPNDIFINAIAIISSGKLIAGTPYDICFSSNAGATWDTDNIAQSSPINTLLGDSNLIFAPASNGTGCGISSNNGLQWDTVGLGGLYVLCSASDNSGNLFFGTETGLFKSSDDGRTWERSDNGIPSALGSPGISSLISFKNGFMIASNYNMWQGFDSNNQPHFYHMWGFDRTSDHGKSWQIIQNANNGKMLTAIDGQTAFAYVFPTLIVSHDTGSTWTPVHSSLDSVYILSVYARDSLHLFVGTETEGVQYSDDGGIHWQSRNIGLPSTNILVIIEDSILGLLCGTSGHGVFKSTDDGTTWQQANNGIESRTINALLKTQGGNLLAATDSGLFGTTGQTSVPIIQKRSFMPNTISISTRVDPNEVHVEYTIPNAGSVHSELYDVIGRKIIEINHGESETAGTHQFSIDLSSFQTGIYYCYVMVNGLRGIAPIAVIK